MGTGPTFAAEAQSRYATETLREVFRAGCEFGYGYRRGTTSDEDRIVRTGSLVIDLAKGFVMNGYGRVVVLSRMEWGVLAALAGYAGQTAPTKAILAEVWGAEFVNDTHYVRMYVGYLRAKIGADYIANEHGRGYRLVMLPPVQAEAA